MNGLTGLKPTWGRVSRAGIFPLAESLDHIGPMTRSALDCAIMLGVIAGADERDATAVPVPVPDYAGSIAQGVKGRRIGRPTGLGGLDDDGRRALDGAFEVLGRAGATIVDVALPVNFDQAAVDWVALCAVECAIAHEATYPARAGEYGGVLAGLIEVGRRLSGTDLARLQLRRAAITGGLNRLLASVDLLLMPVMPRAVWSLEALAAAGRDPAMVGMRLRYTAPFDMSGSPTITLPGGFTAAGLPVGFQLVGRHFDEALVLRAGHAYQGASDWHAKRPPV
jgi:amidase